MCALLLIGRIEKIEQKKKTNCALIHFYDASDATAAMDALQDYNLESFNLLIGYGMVIYGNAHNHSLFL